MQVLRAHRPHLLAAIVLAGAVLATAVGCATSAAAPSKPEAALPGKPACFFLVNFRGDWTVLSDSTLIVATPPGRQAYFIKLFRPIYGLRFHESLGFRDVERSGQICGNAQDDLVVRGGGQSPVPIVELRQITPVEQRQLLLAAGLKVPAYLQKQAGAANAD